MKRNKIEMGMVFLFLAKSQFIGLIKKYKIARVLDVDTERNTVHLCIYRESEDNSSFDIEIYHLPIEIDLLLGSIKSVVRIDEYELTPASEAAMIRWNDKYDSEQAGRFSIPLAEIIKETLSMVKGHIVLSSYPKKGDSGEFNILTVEASKELFYQ